MTDYRPPLALAIKIVAFHVADDNSFAALLSERGGCLMAFSATWFLLEQEGLLAPACLCNGLTALRRANLGDKKGLFYSAFFELSIGFERVLKLVLILDHMERNKLVPPDSKTVEDYGHKPRSLFYATKGVCATHGVTVLDVFQADSLSIVILGFLDDVAHPGGRYSNINKLTGQGHQAMADPIVQWGEIASQIMQTKATPRERQRAQLKGGWRVPHSVALRPA